MAPILEICIPTYNRAEKVIKTIEFLISERALNAEPVAIHVKDNYSSDQTSQLLAERFNDVPDLKISRNEKNVGLIGNLLLLIKESKGKYTWLVGDDDILHAGILGEILKTIKEDPNYVFINHRAIYENGTPAFTSAIPESKPKDLLDIFNFSFGSVMFITASVYKTEVIKKITEKQLNATNPARLSSPLFWALSAGATGNFKMLHQQLITNVWGDISWKDERYKVAIMNIPTEIIKCFYIDYPKLKVLKSLSNYYFQYSIKFLKKIFA